MRHGHLDFIRRPLPCTIENSSGGIPRRRQRLLHLLLRVSPIPLDENPQSDPPSSHPVLEAWSHGADDREDEVGCATWPRVHPGGGGNHA